MKNLLAVLSAVTLPVLLSAATSSASAPAAEEIPPAEKPVEPPKPLATQVVSAARLDTPGKISPQSTALPTEVTVLSHESLERTNFTRDFGDLLRRAPGVVAHSINQGDVGTAIKMRGFLTRSHGADAAVYVDGLAQNLPSSALSDGMTDLSWLTPEVIDNIEIIKGPFSALYGNQNRSGAVNITTRSFAPFSSARVDFGSDGYQRANLTAAENIGAVQTFFSADLHHSDGYRDHSTTDRAGFFGKISSALGEGQIGVRLAYQEADWDAPGMLRRGDLLSGAVKPTDRDPYTAPAWGDARRASVVLTRTPDDPNFGWESSLGYEYYERTRAVGATLTDLNVLYDQRHILNGRALQNLQPADSLLLTVGTEFRYDNGDAESRRWSNSAPTANYAFNYDLSLLSYGAFAQAQWKPVNFLKLVGGLRGDGFYYDIDNRRNPAASATYNDPVFTPRIGLVLTPVDNLDIYANYGQGFRPPASNELSPYSGIGPLNSPGGSAVSGLDASTVESFDLGLRYAFLPGWSLEIEGYHTDNSDETVQVSPGVYENVGNTTRAGFDVQLEWLATDNLAFYASYSRILKADIESAAPGSATELSLPRDTYKAGVAYTIPLTPEQRILLNFDAYYISGIPYFVSGAKNYSRPYARYDIRAAYELRRWTFSLGLTYQPISNSSEAAYASGGDLVLDPRPKYSVLGSARVTF